LSLVFPELEAFSLKRLGLRDASDLEIFQAARHADALVITKDADFLELLLKFGPPPKVIWLTCGNTSNDVIQKILLEKLPIALECLSAGEPLLEIY
jgi:predicted nuclease of predicted toxin-antitoxin system